ncbi:unnamed protein product [Paramecium primaurelia]|uniref:Uncharacterized protein n=1 Tax=Paramecium primaurelia TaxID=5886 RepID=A0A8S1NDR1_PARPR|nr:unnamed protein product [Paramecium primaurelia]
MNTQSIVDQLKNKVEECLKGVQQQLDSSFNIVEAFLDQLPLAHHHLFKSLYHPTNIHQLTNSRSKTYNKFQYSLKSQVHSSLTLIITNKKIENNRKHNNQHQLNLKTFTYNLLQDKSINQSEYCGAITINKDNTIVLVGCNKQIEVFEFKQEQLKLTQLLSENTGYVLTLNFIKKQNQFLFGNRFGQIIIWFMNQNSQWECQQILNSHYNYINCLIINNNDDFYHIRN